MYRPQRGFTILELLVVIGVIAILSSLCFPVFFSVRQASRRTVCLNNLRQIGMAFSLYLGDHAEAFPNTGSNFLWNGRQWRPVIDPYVGNRAIYWCPADINAKRKYDSTSYAYLQSFYHSDEVITAGAASMLTVMDRGYHTCGAPTVTRTLAEVASPSEKILVYEWTANHDKPSCTMWDMTGNHNALFVDGHAQRVTQEMLAVSALGDHDPNWTVNGLAGTDLLP